MIALSLSGIAIGFLILGWAVYRQRRDRENRRRCHTCGKIHKPYPVGGFLR